MRKKQIILSILCLFLTYSVLYAQSEKNQFISIKLGGVLGTYKGGYFATEYRNKQYIIGLRTLLANTRADNIPSDYHSGLCLIGSCYPLEEYLSFELVFGKSISMNTDNKILLKPMIGFSYTLFKIPENFQPDSCAGFICFKSNYSYDNDIKNRMGLVINPEVNFMFSQTFGVSFSPMANINAFKNAYEIKIGLLFNIEVGKKKYKKLKLMSNSD